MPTGIKKYLHQQLEQHSIFASEKQSCQLIQYIELLQQWNQAYNLIANAEATHIVDRHIIDSLLVLPYLKGIRIIDVGSGAGLPGIPLAILMPECNFVLLDSNGKKTRFMTQAKVTLGLENIHVINKRVEEYKPDELFDIVISRAFAELKKMLSLTQHLCQPRGLFIALKGDDISKEIENLPVGFKCHLAERLPFADPYINRAIVIVKKA